MQHKLTKNKKLKPKCLLCIFYPPLLILDARKDTDTDRKLGFTLLINFVWIVHWF